MKQEQQHGPLEPQDVEELLPWYVTGRVSREEARGIEAALKSMPDLAGKLAQVQREREAVARASETAESAPPETLQRLLQQVETTRQWRVPKIENHGEAGGWIRAALSRNAVWQTALVAACVAIVALSVQALQRAGRRPVQGRRQHQRRGRRHSDCHLPADRDCGRDWNASQQPWRKDRRWPEAWWRLHRGTAVGGGQRRRVRNREPAGAQGFGRGHLAGTIASSNRTGLAVDQPALAME